MGKKRLLWARRAQWLAACVALCAGPLQAGERLRLLTEEFAPYSTRDEVGELSGPAVLKVKALMKRSGLTYTLEVKPWARAYATAATDSSACIFSTVRTPEREEDFAWIGPLSSNYTMAIFGRADDPRKPTKLDDIRGAVIGSYHRSATAEYLRMNGFELDIAPDDRLNPVKLKQGRFDYWVAGKTHGLTLLRQQHLRGQIRLLFEFNRASMYLACNRHLSPQTLELLRAKWHGMVADHTVARIDARFPER